MLWLRGPAGVGKSTVAQTIAEQCQTNGRLGAAFFFSRPNKRNNPDRVIPTLAYQIAVQIPEYKALVGKQLAEDPALMAKTQGIQFRRLIVEPLSRIQLKKKILIVLDGLDECKGEAAQRNLVELVNGAVTSNIRLPVLWMICSRPESHLKALFARVDDTICCWKEELPIDSDESQQDVALYLRASLNDIHRQYPNDIVVNPWPSEECIIMIALAASGLFVFVETVIKFVGDSKYANPERRLEVVIKALKRSRDIGTRNPMEALDQLYSQIMSEIPEEILPTTMQILGFLVYIKPYYSSALPAINLANHLDLARLDFYGAPRKLHSVLRYLVLS